MSQPVKLSDDLVSDARSTAELSQRSIAGQIEFWAQLGRAAELLLNGAQARALHKTGRTASLSQLLSTVDSAAGRKRLNDQLAGQPFPHYEPAPAKPGVLVRIEADGTRTEGRFIGREFQSIKAITTKPEPNHKKSSAKARNTDR